MTRATSRIDLKDNLMAEQLMELFRPYSVYASQRGSTVYVDDLALEVLEQLVDFLPTAKAGGFSTSQPRVPAS